MESTARLEMRIGLLVTAGIAAVVVLILLSDRISFDGSYEVTVYLDDAGGLNVGSPVKLSGITIGSVQNIKTSDKPKFGAIAATITVKDRFTIDQRAALENRTSGIFGDAYLAFSPPPGEVTDPLPKDGSAEVLATSPFLDRATEQLQNILDGVAEVVDERGRADIKRLIGGSADLVAEATDLAVKLNGQSGQLEALLIKVEALVEDLAGTNRQLGSRLTTTLDELDATLVSVRGFADEGTVRLAELSARADGLMAAGTALARRGDAVLADNQPQIDALVDDIAALAGSLQRIVEDVEAGRGVVGQLLRSDALAADLNDTVITGKQLVERISDSPEIVVWGTSKEDRADARADRRRRQVRRAFMEGYAVRDPIAPVVEAPPAADATGTGEPDLEIEVEADQVEVIEQAPAPDRP